MKKTVICLTLLLAALTFNQSANGQKHGDGKKAEPTPVIVFVCEHGAAKSIVAAAHFNRLAEEQHLNLRAIARGTNPDQELAPKAVQGLRADGLVSGETAPKKISKADLVGTKRIITFCELPDDYASGLRVVDWDDLPPLGEDYNKFRDKLVERLRVLLAELKSEK